MTSPLLSVYRLGKRILRSISKPCYQTRLASEGDRWGQYFLNQEIAWHSWLHHPLILEHYKQSLMIENVPWQEYVVQRLGRAARRSLELGCGSNARSLEYFRTGIVESIEGIDISAKLISEAERLRQEIGAPGCFWVGDVNVIELPPETYDLIFACHAFHHFLELEHILQQVHQALTPEGLFVLEEFVGPTRFQWTDQQLAVVQSLLRLLPEEFRMRRQGGCKNLEVRPDPDELQATSPFEAIRSAEIVPLFMEHFETVAALPLGGTIQQLLYNDIIHNFNPDDAQGQRYIEAIISVEDALIRAGLLPSDFMLLIGKRKY